MKKNPKYLAITILTFLSAVSHLSASLMFSDNFDSELADEGTPDGFFSFGTSLTSIVVNSRNPFSAPNSMIFTLDLTEGWGGGVVKQKFEPTDLTDATISAKIAASKDLEGINMISFRIEDEDGTIMRANIANMFSPSTEYNHFELPLNRITQIDARGADSRLNFEKIVSYGMCFYNNDRVTGVVHFFIDDLSIKSGSSNLIGSK